ncbi:dihydroorotate dehydrogenase electron transfer subunit [Aquibacillus sediminis]|uniref:dihydroorotate dehydrogenase electron transfer subunit n=1 Tax=Aquibacillus sediminis TaxID=2574734 RepID=UPI0011081823|nr:dihydroorotate dehydrogenase electron transfer subunit [Aquibacillus sediminis]
MKKKIVEVTKVETIAQDTIEMTLAAPGITTGIQPGQFVHINVGSNSSHLLRRPISIADVDLMEQTVTIIFKVVGSGTAQLGQYKVGERLEVLLPCGTGYPIDSINMSKALLIGGGIGVPPLYYLGKKLADQGIEVISILGFQSSSNVFYESKFNQLGDCHVVTDDGTYGYKGYVTDVVDQLSLKYDYYFSCGPTGMLQAVTNKLAYQDGYISIEQRMGCGIGACYACVVPTNDGTNGFKKICKDGPVFRANEVVLR